MSGDPLVRMIASWADFERQMRKVTASLASIDFPALRKTLDALNGYDEHHPKPLPINGREYARRRRNR